MTFRHFHTLGFAALIIAGAVAAKADPIELGTGRMTYEVFEQTVEHADLASCPEEFDRDAQFCRMTLADGMAHVFVFDMAGEQAMAAIKSYDLSHGLPAF